MSETTAFLAADGAESFPTEPPSISGQARSPIPAIAAMAALAVGAWLVAGQLFLHSPAWVHGLSPYSFGSSGWSPAKACVGSVGLCAAVVLGGISIARAAGATAPCSVAAGALAALWLAPALARTAVLLLNDGRLPRDLYRAQPWVQAWGMDGLALVLAGALVGSIAMRARAGLLTGIACAGALAFCYWALFHLGAYWALEGAAALGQPWPTALAAVAAATGAGLLSWQSAAGGRR